MEPTREIYWNIAAHGLIYVFLIAAIAGAAYGIGRRFRLWRLGEAEDRLDRIPERLTGLLSEIFGHRRHFRDPFAGTAHLLIFYGFLAQLVATGIISVQESTGAQLLKGTFYLWYSVLSDSFGLLGLVGLGMACWRRLVQRPQHLHTATGDWFALTLLLLIFLQGFLLEGCRVALLELHAQPELAPWSPGGHLVALVLQYVSADHLYFLHRFTWWFHAATVFWFIGYLGYAKFNHIFFGPANIFLRNLDPSGKLRYPDIEAMLDTDPDALDTLGVDRIEQYSWKSLLDLDACVDCGRCEEACPAHASGVPLSPRKLIRDLHDHLDRVGPALLAARAPGKGEEEADTQEQERTQLFGEASDDGPQPAVLEQELWGCRTCGACQRECPMHIEHIPKIVDMRRYLVMTEAKMSDDAQLFLKNMDDRMHPFAGAGHDREEWFQDLDLKIFGNGDTAEYLLWVGCAGSMVDRNIAVTRALVNVLQKAGVDFAILGAEEVCTGDPARRVGGELTFQVCAKTIIDIFAGYGIEKIITACPHCFNTFENEYPDFGGNYQVVHHTQLISDLLQSGRLKLKRRLESLTYHDPCYLGRHNGVFDAPRRVLGGLAPQGALLELARSESSSFCCGSGGGYAWMDDDPKQRINHLRFEELMACGAQTAALACPFCMQMFDDAQSALDVDKNLRVADIAELVSEALED
jgi:Fe-S oxidoreductase/nitrate reductase gamma subunit